MSNLDRALAEISAIRGQMARASEFRGYGPATFAATALLAVLAAVAQDIWLKDPAAHVGAYLSLWIGVAAASAAIIGLEMVTRSRRMHSDLAGEMIRAAVEQFLPAAAAGALITAVLWRFAAQSLPLIPGLWQIIFGLGVFASCRFLPRAMALVGVWYLAIGLVCLAHSGGAQAFSPWGMGLAFGVGQGLVAVVLQRGVGNDHG
ncbi:MAG TPA: hypothetical protein VHZ26_16585 [Caulobacteraceae bacterium]|jgi:hypothetical protein|nr:hypothetical protein [Caulobacteraceae bacterium]